MAINKEEARRAILDITSRLLADGGLEAVRIRDIAKQAKVSVGSVYNIFGDVDDLLRACNTHLLDGLGAAGSLAIAEAQANGVTDVRERLLLLSRVYHDFVDEHATAWNAMLSFNRAVATNETPDWYIVRQEMLFDIITEVLRDTSLAEDEAKLNLAARALWSSVHGIVTNAYRGVDDNRLSSSTWEQIDLLVTTFVRGIERAAIQ
ncbi:MAG: TetR/AcrR family transcriptional regulator [Pseudomonadota bacterium]